METNKFLNQLIGLISVSVVTTVLSVLGICLITLDLWVIERWANPPYRLEIFNAWHIANLSDKRILLGLASLSVFLGIVIPFIVSLCVPRIRKYTLTPPRPPAEASGNEASEKPIFVRGIILLAISSYFTSVLIAVFGGAGLLDNLTRVNMCRAATSVEVGSDCPKENRVSGLLLSRDSEY